MQYILDNDNILYIMLACNYLVILIKFKTINCKGFPKLKKITRRCLYSNIRTYKHYFILIIIADINL